MKKFKFYIILIIFICPFMLQIILQIESYSFSNKEIKNKKSNDINETKIKTANPTWRAWNYDDEIVENNIPIYNDALNDYQSVSIGYNIKSHGYCIVKGVKYKYDTVGIGTKELEFTFWGEDFTDTPIERGAIYIDSNIPQVSSDSWRTFYCTGPIYTIDDDPRIEIKSTDDSSDCVRLCADTPSYGHSFYDLNGIGYSLDVSYEYIAELLFEEIPTLASGDAITGTIDGFDFIDAYFVRLSRYGDAEFSLRITSGDGNLTMRLVELDSLTQNTLESTLITGASGYMNFYPYDSLGKSNPDTYLLLVEPINPGIDHAEYVLKWDTDYLYFSGNSDLDAYFALSNNDGLTKETAYKFSNLNSDHFKVKIEKTERHVIIKDCTFSIEDMSDYSNYYDPNFPSFEKEVVAGLSVISLIECSNIKIINCEFKENDGDAILIKECNDIEISDCEISKNKGHGINIVKSKDIEISENDIESHHYGDYFDSIGIKLRSCNNSKISKNNFNDNNIGIHLTACHNNDINENNVKNNRDYGLFLDRSHDNVIKSNKFLKNRIPISVEANCYGNIIENNTIQPDDLIYSITTIIFIIGFISISIYTIYYRKIRHFKIEGPKLEE